VSERVSERVNNVNDHKRQASCVQLPVTRVMSQARRAAMRWSGADHKDICLHVGLDSVLDGVGGDSDES